MQKLKKRITNAKFSKESPKRQTGQNALRQERRYEVAKEAMGQILAGMDKQIELEDIKVTFIADKLGIEMKTL